MRRTATAMIQTDSLALTQRVPTNVAESFEEARKPRTAQARAMLAQAQEMLAKIAAKPGDGPGKKRGLEDYRNEGTRSATMFYTTPYALWRHEDFDIRDRTTDAYKLHVVDLAHSIAQVGVQTPLKVMIKDGKILVVKGMTVLDAVFYAVNYLDAKVAVPVITVHTGSVEPTNERLMIAKLGGNKSKRYSDAELAEAYARMIDLWGMTPDRIAQMQREENPGEGVSGQTVRNILQRHKVMSDNPELRKLVEAGTAARSTVISAVGHAGGNPKKAVSLLDEAKQIAAHRGSAVIRPRDLETVAAKVGSAKPKKANKANLQVLDGTPAPEAKGPVPVPEIDPAPVATKKANPGQTLADLKALLSEVVGTAVQGGEGAYTMTVTAEQMAMLRQLAEI